MSFGISVAGTHFLFLLFAIWYVSILRRFWGLGEREVVLGLGIFAGAFLCWWFFFTFFWAWRFLWALGFFLSFVPGAMRGLDLFVWGSGGFFCGYFTLCTGHWSR